MPKHGRKVVFGLLQTRAALENCLSTLQEEGFRREDISVLIPEKGQAHTFAHQKKSKAPKGASLGGIIGALLGGTVAGLLGAGLINIGVPEFAAMAAAGPTFSVWAGVGAGGVIGASIGALVGWRIPEYEAKRYQQFVVGGGILVSVHVDDHLWKKKAQRLLESAGAKDIASTLEVRQRTSGRDVTKESFL